jgi:hypothetical protein
VVQRVGLVAIHLSHLDIADLDLNKAEDRKIYAEHRKQRDSGGLKANLIINN